MVRLWQRPAEELVRADLGVRPFMYLSKSNANTYWTSTIASQHDLWLAIYKGTGTTQPPVQSAADALGAAPDKGKLPQLRGDVIRERLAGADGFIYWTGAKYAWSGLVSL